MIPVSKSNDGEKQQNGLPQRIGGWCEPWRELRFVAPEPGGRKQFAVEPPRVSCVSA